MPSNMGLRSYAAFSCYLFNLHATQLQASLDRMCDHRIRTLFELVFVVFSFNGKENRKTIMRASIGCTLYY